MHCYCLFLFVMYNTDIIRLTELLLLSLKTCSVLLLSSFYIVFWFIVIVFPKVFYIIVNAFVSVFSIVAHFRMFFTFLRLYLQM